MTDPFAGVTTASPAVKAVVEPTDRAQSTRPDDRLVPSRTMAWRRAFTGVTEDAPKARAFVRCLLAGTRWVEEVEFATAELVNNALLHSRSGRPGGYFVVEVTRRPRRVRVGVYDLGGSGAPRLPVASGGAEYGDRLAFGDDDAAEPGAGCDLLENGRGLLALSRMATRIGYRGDPVTGHHVWALFTDSRT
ncbi:hypothetical protein Sme01_43160 [Sphaerisporangium melleum]|uniref:Histidine kinase/HSP90-like ATPase domain-containing protein n=1 Tax=Sphaerisporangium melleum TaxID=321316 RepID=A0A917VHC6_9ACTN|nr:ATP-binding protein [Sphaerisporangium melleum]GGK77370.1 hypothetical protein GCM10007964_20120 [Sphaerisporangium melleum]GII71840.1 hypothetical protein Sme01_43160 [Sphaerisporangium melleum]